MINPSRLLNYSGIIKSGMKVNFLLLGDDICGVSTSVRFNSHLILIWNRDGSNQKSIDAILKRVLDNIPEEMKPQPQNYYYKKHSEHKGYKALDGSKPTTSSTMTSSTEPTK